jgi:hypothetical protein
MIYGSPWRVLRSKPNMLHRSMALPKDASTEVGCSYESCSADRSKADIRLIGSKYLRRVKDGSEAKASCAGAN